MPIAQAGRLRAVAVAAAVTFATAGLQAAPVTTHFTDFNAFTTGSVNGQGGWAVTGSYTQEVVDLGAGNKALRLSNNTTSGSFSDMPFAPRPGGTGMTPANPTNSQPQYFAGESSTGASYSRFIGSFDFRSILDAFDSGARITISPDNGLGARQGFIALESKAGGVEVSTFDVDAGGNFVGPMTLGTIGFSQWANLRYEIDFYDGAFNDVAKVYLNNSLVATIKSWESFYAANQPLLHPNGVPVQTFLFRLSGTAAPNAQGFYIDNVRVQLDNRVPEPASLVLVGLALAGLVVAGRRRH